MIKSITFAAVAALLVAMPAQAMDLKEITAKGGLAAMERTANKNMIGMLDEAKKALSTATGDIRRLGVVCPHAMLAIAAIGAGNLGVEEGTRQFLTGLVQDREASMKSIILTGETVNVFRGEIDIAFKMSGAVSNKDLIGVIEAGQRFLSE